MRAFYTYCFVSFFFLTSFLGCAGKPTREGLKASLEVNPDILIEALEKSGSKFIDALQRIQTESQRTAQLKVQEEESARLDKELKAPKNPVIDKDRAVLGKRNAPIKVVAYSDFECPYCARGYENIEQLRKKYKEKVFFTFKHFPLPFHARAMPAAKRFEAIALQSAEKAYRFQDEVFKNQQEFIKSGENFLDRAAAKVGANVQRMKKDMDSPVVKARIDSDMAEAQSFGIQGTPAFLVNGVSLYGAYPLSSFEAILAKQGVEGVYVVGQERKRSPAPEPEEAKKILSSLEKGRPSLGEKDAPIQIHLFEDLSCGMCKYFYRKSISKLQDTYIKEGKVRLVFIDFPLGMMKGSTDLAEMALCAKDEGKYHDFIKMTLEDDQNTEDFKTAQIRMQHYKEQIGLNSKKFSNCMDSHKYLPLIKDGFEAGSKMSVDGTPSFFINGKYHGGAKDFSALSKLINGA